MLLETIQDENLGIPEYHQKAKLHTTRARKKGKIIWEKERQQFSPLFTSGTRKMSSEHVATFGKKLIGHQSSQTTETTKGDRDDDDDCVLLMLDSILGTPPIGSIN